jgi:hypothetical protein
MNFNFNPDRPPDQPQSVIAPVKRDNTDIKKPTDGDPWAWSIENTLWEDV